MARAEVACRIVETSWGPMAIVARGDRLAGVVLPGDSTAALRRAIADRWPGAVERANLLPALARQIVAYFDGRSAEFDVDLDLDAQTDFQRRVLRACRRIPPGEVVTYGDLARSVGSPRAARAAGQVMAANPMPLVIPCHRVVGCGGQLGGFSASGGLMVKQRMLAHERPMLARVASRSAGSRRSGKKA